MPGVKDTEIVFYGSSVSMNNLLMLKILNVKLFGFFKSRYNYIKTISIFQKRLESSESTYLSQLFYYILCKYIYSN